jgi:excinuclease UvrABC ATPase subunit
VQVRIPERRIVEFTGVSGSGKSSLVAERYPRPAVHWLG